MIPLGGLFSDEKPLGTRAEGNGELLAAEADRWGDWHRVSSRTGAFVSRSHCANTHFGGGRQKLHFPVRRGRATSLRSSSSSAERDPSPRTCSEAGGRLLAAPPLRSRAEPQECAKPPLFSPLPSGWASPARTPKSQSGIQPSSFMRCVFQRPKPFPVSSSAAKLGP